MYSLSCKTIIKFYIARQQVILLFRNKVQTTNSFCVEFGVGFQSEIIVLAEGIGYDASVHLQEKWDVGEEVKKIDHSVFLPIKFPHHLKG